MEAFKDIGAYPGLSVVKCPGYHECGDYALKARPSPTRIGRMQVLCPYHAQKLEREELECETLARSIPGGE